MKSGQIARYIVLRPRRQQESSLSEQKLLTVEVLLIRSAHKENACCLTVVWCFAIRCDSQSSIGSVKWFSSFHTMHILQLVLKGMLVTLLLYIDETFQK